MNEKNVNTSKFLFNYNHAVDKIFPCTLKPAAIKLNTKYYYKNIANWLSCKKTLCSNSFLGLQFVYWTITYSEKIRHCFL